MLRNTLFCLPEHNLCWFSDLMERTSGFFTFQQPQNSTHQIASQQGAKGVEERWEIKSTLTLIAFRISTVYFVYFSILLKNKGVSGCNTQTIYRKCISARFFFLRSSFLFLLTPLNLIEPGSLVTQRSLRSTRRSGIIVPREDVRENKR